MYKTKKAKPTIDFWNNPEKIKQDLTTSYRPFYRRHRQLNTAFDPNGTPTVSFDPETGFYTETFAPGVAINPVVTRYKAIHGNKKRQKDLYYLDGLFYVICKQPLATVYNDAEYHADNWHYYFCPFTGNARDNNIWHSIYNHIPPCTFSCENGSITAITFTEGSDLTGTEIPPDMLHDATFIDYLLKITCDPDKATKKTA